MDLLESLRNISVRADQLKDSIQTEEATKTALVLPFLQALGYDVFNPREIVPEFTCDFGVKKGEKVDYAICKDGVPSILIECKQLGRNLDRCDGQLFRYFAVSRAKFGILTNGIEYRFYGDLDKPNLLDSSPFFTYRLDAPERGLEATRRFSKVLFEPTSVANWANAQKDSARVKSVLVREFAEPSADFIRTILRSLEISPITQKSLEQFGPIIKTALDQIVNDRITAAFSRALNTTEKTPSTAQDIESAQESENAPNQEVTDDALSSKDRIVTTIEELEAFFIVRSILRQTVAPQRIKHRDTLSYFGVLLDDNNRKPICRLYIERDGESRKKKFIGLFDKNKNETRKPLKVLDDIYKYEKELIETASYYL